MRAFKLTAIFLMCIFFLAGCRSEVSAESPNEKISEIEREQYKQFLSGDVQATIDSDNALIYGENNISEAFLGNNSFYLKDIVQEVHSYITDELMLELNGESIPLKISYGYMDHTLSQGSYLALKIEHNEIQEATKTIESSYGNYCMLLLFKYNDTRKEIETCFIFGTETWGKERIRLINSGIICITDVVEEDMFDYHYYCIDNKNKAIDYYEVMFDNHWLYSVDLNSKEKKEYEDIYLGYYCYSNELEDDESDDEYFTIHHYNNNGKWEDPTFDIEPDSLFSMEHPAYSYFEKYEYGIIPEKIVRQDLYEKARKIGISNEMLHADSIEWFDCPTE